jgi:hypothetical protein
MIIEILEPKTKRSGNTVICQCDYCGKEFNRKYSEVVKGNKKHHFCCSKCRTNYFSGSNSYFHTHSFMIDVHLYGYKNGNWKGGRTKSTRGYIYIFVPEHPYSDKKGYFLESRLVMEKYLERYLLPEEIVHHINGIKDDNRIENLMLFDNIGDHSSFERKLQLLKKG